MKLTFLGIAAAALGGLFLPANVRASETKLLAGVGSLSGTPDLTAPVITLKGDASNTPDTIEVNGPIARGVGGVARVGGRAVVGVGRVGVGTFRYAAGYPFYRPWVGYRPWGYNRAWYGFYRPWGLYRPWFYPGIALNFGFGGYPYVAGYGGSYPSAVVYSSPPICSCPTYAGPPPQATETAPPPRPTDGYRYDGGPTRPVPAPKGGFGPQTPPVPPATFDTVARRSTKKLEYPAYGESPGKSRPVQDPLLVKTDRSK
jgi:hypothetical protein